MKYAAHRIVTAPYKLSKNTIININNCREWVYISHCIENQELSQTQFFNGILFPSFPLILNDKFPKTICDHEYIYPQFIKTKINLSVNKLLEDICYSPMQIALENSLNHKKNLVLLDNIDWDQFKITANSRIKIILTD